MWTFGTNELISLIAALATFSAVIVSLYLALKSKTVKFKVFIKKNAKLIVINTGDTKFTINGFGVKIDDDYYMNTVQRFSKILPVAKEVRYTNNHTSSSKQELSIGQAVLEQGDFVESGITDFDFSLCNSTSKLFLVINCKIHLYKFDYDISEKNEIKKNNFKKYTEEEVKYSGLYTGI
jgi:hypothetical protein